MRTIFYFLILCTLSSCNADSLTGVKIQTDSTKISSTKPNISETLSIPFKDSITLSANINYAGDTRNILVKDSVKDDFWKYVIPIFTLLLGIGVNKALDYFSERKRIKKVGKRWVAEIRGLESPIRSQIDALSSFLTEHKKEVFAMPELTIFSILDCEVFKSMDKSDFLEFIEKNKSSDYKSAIYISK